MPTSPSSKRGQSPLKQRKNRNRLHIENIVFQTEEDDASKPEQNSDVDENDYNHRPNNETHSRLQAGIFRPGETIHGSLILENPGETDQPCTIQLELIGKASVEFHQSTTQFIANENGQTAYKYKGHNTIQHSVLKIKQTPSMTTAKSKSFRFFETNNNENDQHPSAGSSVFSFGHHSTAFFTNLTSPLASTNSNSNSNSNSHTTPTKTSNRHSSGNNQNNNTILLISPGTSHIPFEFHLKPTAPGSVHLSKVADKCQIKYWIEVTVVPHPSSSSSFLSPSASSKSNIFASPANLLSSYKTQQLTCPIQVLPHRVLAKEEEMQHEQQQQEEEELLSFDDDTEDQITSSLLNNSQQFPSQQQHALCRPVHLQRKNFAFTEPPEVDCGSCFFFRRRRRSPPKELGTVSLTLKLDRQVYEPGQEINITGTTIVNKTNQEQWFFVGIRQHVRLRGKGAESVLGQTTYAHTTDYCFVHQALAPHKRYQFHGAKFPVPKVLPPSFNGTGLGHFPVVQWTYQVILWIGNPSAVNNEEDHHPEHHSKKSALTGKSSSSSSTSGGIGSAGLTAPILLCSEAPPQPSALELHRYISMLSRTQSHDSGGGERQNHASALSASTDSHHSKNYPLSGGDDGDEAQEQQQQDDILVVPNGATLWNILDLSEPRRPPQPPQKQSSQKQSRKSHRRGRRLRQGEQEEQQRQSAATTDSTMTPTDSKRHQTATNPQPSLRRSLVETSHKLLHEEDVSVPTVSDNELFAVPPLVQNKEVDCQDSKQYDFRNCNYMVLCKRPEESIRMMVTKQTDTSSTYKRMVMN